MHRASAYLSLPLFIKRPCQFPVFIVLLKSEGVRPVRDHLFQNHFERTAQNMRVGEEPTAP